MTLKTFACDSIAEKNDFVNHFFPSKETKKRGVSHYGIYFVSG